MWMLALFSVYDLDSINSILAAASAAVALLAISDSSSCVGFGTIGAKVDDSLVDNSSLWVLLVLGLEVVPAAPK